MFQLRSGRTASEYFELRVEEHFRAERPDLYHTATADRADRADRAQIEDILALYARHAARGHRSPATYRAAPPDVDVLARMSWQEADQLIADLYRALED